MKHRQTLLLAALGIVATVLIYHAIPQKSRTADSPAARQKTNAGQPANPENTPSQAASPAGGRDGAFTTAPSRAQDALVDPQPADAPFTAGEKASAWVTVGTQATPELRVNQFGEFPRTYVAPGQQVTVRVQFPDAEPGTRVVAQVEDGGKLDGGKAVLALELDEKHEASFRFQSDKEQGAYRISVHHGPDWKTVQLWAATDPKLAINH